MMRLVVPVTSEIALQAVLDLRVAATERFFQLEAGHIASLCNALAQRFDQGGRLIAAALSPAWSSDAYHVAVEFVHPVIVGKRALPALAMVPRDGELENRLRLIARPDDVVFAFGDEPQLRTLVEYARSIGCLTVGFAPFEADHEFVPPDGDPFLAQELTETLYHVVWELVHVFIEHDASAHVGFSRDVGASGLLYPFLAGPTGDLNALLADVRQSVLMKAAEISELRTRTAQSGAQQLREAAFVLRERFEAGGILFALGNGGSATDAMDIVADFCFPPPNLPPRAAVDLTADSAIITALSNDVGDETVFARQVGAYARTRDAVIAFSTSGNSRNVIRALAEARQRGAFTIAFTGYDGGRIHADRLADYVIVAPSQHIPRIQEAHATAYHLLRMLVEEPVPAGMD